MKKKKAKRTVPEIPKILEEGKNFGKLGCIIVVKEDFLKKVNRFYMELYKIMNELLPQKYKRTPATYRSWFQKPEDSVLRAFYSKSPEQYHTVIKAMEMAIVRIMNKYKKELDANTKLLAMVTKHNEEFKQEVDPFLIGYQNKNIRNKKELTEYQEQNNG